MDVWLQGETQRVYGISFIFDELMRDFVEWMI